MSDEALLYIQRAENELVAAQVLFDVSSKVTLQKEEFKIVGAEEASPLEGKISIKSPLGQAFFNQPKGAVVEVKTPKGIAQYKILKIE